jgi:ribosomal protein S18 acetylase RimI-like enzyme
VSVEPEVTRPGNDAVLDNAVWHALRGPHAPFAEIHGSARRYRPDVSVFHAIEDDAPDSWAALGATAQADGSVVLFRALMNTPPAGWEVVMTGDGYQMVLTGPPDPGATVPRIDEESGATVELRSLDDGDVAAMRDLVRLTEPGPFKARTIELGGYVGIFHDAELVAMAGQRLRPAGFCEVSAVCTHPQARRRRYASILTAHVANGIRERGETPFLHLSVTNTHAHAAYERLGFEVRTRVAFGVYRIPERSITATNGAS